jgi:hypothetical protein
MKHFLSIAVLFGLFSLSTAPALGAPIPGAGSSKLISPELGIYRSPLGFQIHAGASGWKHTEPPASSQFITTMYTAHSPAATSKQNKKGAISNGTLTVRIDPLSRETTLDRYIQKWQKEFPRYGFDMLSSKSFTQNKQKGFVMDLINRDNKKQLRQVVFLKKQHAVIITCRDNTQTFKETLKGCNQIIRTFDWKE